VLCVWWTGCTRGDLLAYSRRASLSLSLSVRMPRRKIFNGSFSTCVFGDLSAWKIRNISMRSPVIRAHFSITPFRRMRACFVEWRRGRICRQNRFGLLVKCVTFVPIRAEVLRSSSCGATRGPSLNCRFFMHTSFAWPTYTQICIHEANCRRTMSNF
jgi:hypothetical protein